MTEKLYRVHEWVKYNYSEIGKYIGEGYTDKPMRNDEIVDLLNELSEENEQLRKENEKLESLWEDKCIKEYMKIVGENALQEMHNEKYGDK